jgi:tetratricopeptide (TPR) repeat protein
LSQGRGGIIFLTGDAGLGKSRLIFEAIERLLLDYCPDAQYFESSAYAYESGQPYGLILRLLRGVLGIMPDDHADVVRDRIAAATGGDEQRLRVLEALFGLTPEQPGTGLTGEAFAGQLLLCLDQFWRDRAGSGPVVMALDDLQWVDMSSADLVGRLFPLVENTGVLFLCAVRRERHSAGWRLKETAERDLPHRLVELGLYPLTDSESRQLLAALLGTSDLPEMLQELILDKAEGNPLFVEEVVHHLIERGYLTLAEDGVARVGAEPVNNIDLPDSLQALLTARIDRLEDETRRTLQVAAVIGRFFPRSPLAALVDRPEALDRQLLDLQRMELIREVTRVPEPGYSFNHTLTHEATYNTILLKQRRQMHLRVAETIETLRADNLAIVAPVLAHHFVEGAASRRALPYLIMAADAALQLHATAEAVAFYERAIPIAIENKETPDKITPIYVRRGRALELQSKFREADETYRDMEQRALAYGDKKMELEAIVAQGKLRANVTTLHDPAAARALMARALPLARDLDDRPAEVRILWNLVNTDRFDLNSLEDAVQHGERAIVMARELGLEEELAYLLNDLSDIYGTVGRIKDAWGVLDEAQTRWRAIGNEPMLADTLSNTAMWYQLSGRIRAARESAEEAYAITTRIHNIWGQAYSLAMHGIVIFQLGEIGPAIEELMLATEKAREAHFIGGQVICRSYLAMIYSYLDNHDEAERVALPGVDLAREQLPQFAAMPISRLAIARIFQGNLEGAASLLDDPLTSLEKQQFFVENDVKLARCEFALARGDLDQAIAIAREATQRLGELGYDAWLPEMKACQARAHIVKSESPEARRLLSEAVVAARAMDLKAACWRYLALWAALEDREGHEEAAADLYRQAQQEIDSLLPHLQPDSLRHLFLDQPLVRDVMNHSTLVRY